jgi:ferredoxin-thioredoxin reductase catalytic subunit
VLTTHKGPPAFSIADAQNSYTGQHARRISAMRTTLSDRENSSERALHPDRTHVATVLEGVLRKRPNFGEPRFPMQAH